MPAIDVSSTEIRRRIAAGEPIRRLGAATPSPRTSRRTACIAERHRSCRAIKPPRARPTVRPASVDILSDAVLPSPRSASATTSSCSSGVWATSKQQQPPAADQAMPAAVAAQPILPHVVTQPAGRLECFLQ